MSNDPTRPVTLPGYLGALERRVSEIERSNPIARASWHDGTRTRGGIGVFAHPDGGEQTGAVFYDTAGDVLLLVDDSELTLTETAITGRPAVAAAATDYVLISDTSDGANLKKALVSSIGGGGGGDLLAANNLSDVANADTARTNLGAGDLLASNNLSDVANADTARTNLGAGDLLASNNLSDVANAATARTNLGAGDAAVVATNTTDIAANALTTFNLGSDVAAHHVRLAGIDAVQTTQNADITTLQSQQSTNATAIALNTSKVGITTAQANEITVNTAKVTFPGFSGSGANSVNVGGTDAAGSQASAVGYLSSASATYSTAIGRSASASNTGDTAIGFVSAASGVYSFAGGGYSSATGTQSVSIGYLSSAAGYISTAVGRNTSSANNYGVSVGYAADATGISTIAIGQLSVATPTRAIAIGAQADVSGINGVALGYLATATATGAIALGTSVTAATANTASVNNFEVQGATISFANLPTSAGATGTLWNNSGYVRVA